MSDTILVPTLIILDNDLIGVTDAEFQALAIFHQVQRFENEFREIVEYVTNNNRSKIQ